LPLDPHHPIPRLRQILERSNCTYLIAGQQFAPILPQLLADSPLSTNLQTVYAEKLFGQEHRTENPPVCNIPRHLAYVVYTSGSTGMPKGVMIEHQGMLNHIWAKIDAMHLKKTDIIAQTASQCFDISVWQF